MDKNTDDTLSKDTLSKALDRLYQFQWYADLRTFIEIWGENQAAHFWVKFRETCKFDIVKFYDYLDPINREGFLQWLVDNPDKPKSFR